VSSDQPAPSPSKRPAPTFQIKMFPIGTVGRWPKNPKRHDIEGLIRSMQRFGFTSPPALDQTTGRLYAGHGRDEALNLMKSRGLPPPKGIVSHKGDWWMPVLTGMSFGSETEAEQYLVADNRLVEQGGWDTAHLLDILQRQTPDDRLLVGFDGADLRALIHKMDKQTMQARKKSKEGDGGTGPLDAPQYDSKPGTVYELGPHRLMCGSSESVADLRRLVGNRKIQVVTTDPPYNIGAENDGVAADVSKSHKDLMASEWDGGDGAAPFDPAKSFPLFLEFLHPDCSIYIFTANHLFGWYNEWLKQWTSHYSWCVWSKPDPMPSLMKRHWTWDAELVNYGTRGAHTFNFPDGEHAPSTWRISKSVQDRIHPTQKPVEVFQHALRHSAAPGFVCADFFAGSGSSIIAADMQGVVMLAMEESPRLVNLIRQRWDAYIAKGKAAAAP